MTPDAGGKAFYLEKLNAGEMTLQTITLNVLNGAQNEDLTIVNNKVTVANLFTDNLNSNSFTYAGNSAAETAKGLLDAIGVDASALTDEVDSFFQANNTLSGSWVVDTVDGTDDSGVITFFADNSFIYSIFNAEENSSDLEQGSYSKDADTGAFNFDLTVDNATDSGLSGNAQTQISRLANKLEIETSETLSLSKLETAENSIIGSWYSSDDTGNTQVLSFMTNGQFVVSESSQSETGTETSVEAGQYTWLESTGAFSFDIEYDSNGRGEGFSYSGTNEIQLVGTQLQLTSTGGTELFDAC